MKPLQLFLIRHGETAWSLTGQHTGRTDIALTPHGEDMARRLAPCLAGIHFDRVLTSPRRRASTTCELAGFAATDIEPDLAEWDYGDYEGQRSAQTRQAHPDWDVWRDGCPGGERPADVAGRADRLIARLSTRGGNIALFLHGQFGRVLAARWIGLPAAAGRHLLLKPASINVLGCEPDHADGRVIALWNADPSSPWGGV
ncbi:MAG: histidine phosphatase family protein [Pseudomonadota bacterium]|nr:histidine phosphatase family protein [Pseudomonadota bacterium]